MEEQCSECDVEHLNHQQDATSSQTISEPSVHKVSDSERFWQRVRYAGESRDMSHEYWNKLMTER